MYINEEELLERMQVLRPDFTEDDIEPSWIGAAAADINGELLRSGIPVPAFDIHNLLKNAQMSFYCEIAAQNRQIVNTFGSLSEEKIGDMRTRYDAGMPMFFFASGGSDQFIRLLPHMTWLMRGYRYTGNYIRAYFAYINEGSPFIGGVMATDDTTRGDGWDTAFTDVEG